MPAFRITPYLVPRPAVPPLGPEIFRVHGAPDARWQDAAVMRDPKAVVRAGYDRIAETYAASGRPDPARAAYLALALRAKPVGARCLDLGCGTGTHATKALAAHYDVVGVDISPRSIELATNEVPNATFVVGDMASVEFEPESFDLVTAFYSLVHVPTAEHRSLLEHIAKWLRPGGVLVATMGTPDSGEQHTDDWLGVPMYWSGTTEEASRRALEHAGLAPIIIATESVDEGGAVIRHVWAIARRTVG
jgi:SAM-dependent methyltransferase